jgi:MerR family transcriptional regulator/heat shock protein HspR
MTFSREFAMAINPDIPVFPISVAAKLLGVHPRTIRIYEEEGLISPFRKGQKRFFSKDDIEWLKCVRDLIHSDGISIPGIKKLLDVSPCWEIKSCPEEKRENCTAFVDRTVPCWERVNLACAQKVEQCMDCEAFIHAMKKSRSIFPTFFSS